MGNFQLDSGFEKAFLRSDLVSGVVKDRAETAAVKVRQSTRHATIRAGIEVVVGDQDGIVVARIIAKDFKSHWFEFGTVKMRAEPFLVPGVMAAGFKIEGPKKR